MEQIHIVKLSEPVDLRNRIPAIIQRYKCLKYAISSILLYRTYHKSSGKEQNSSKCVMKFRSNNARIGAGAITKESPMFTSPPAIGRQTSRAVNDSLDPPADRASGCPPTNIVFGSPRGSGGERLGRANEEPQRKSNERG